MIWRAMIDAGPFLCRHTYMPLHLLKVRFSITLRYGISDDYATMNARRRFRVSRRHGIGIAPAPHEMARRVAKCHWSADGNATPILAAPKFHKRR